MLWCNYQNLCIAVHGRNDEQANTLSLEYTREVIFCYIDDGLGALCATVGIWKWAASRIGLSCLCSCHTSLWWQNDALFFVWLKCYMMVMGKHNFQNMEENWKQINHKSNPKMEEHINMMHTCNKLNVSSMPCDLLMPFRSQKARGGAPCSAST
jgi:hypothetical protein